MTLPMPQQDQSMFSYRLDMLTQEVDRLKDQLRQYVTTRENELQLRSLQDAMSRVEHDMIDTKKLTNEIDAKLIAQREMLDRLQIKVLWGVVSIVLTILTAILTGYITHFFH